MLECNLGTPSQLPPAEPGPSIAGVRRGEDGMVREIEFLAPLEVSLLTSRRTTQPYGLDGGKPGAAGRNLLRRSGSAAREELPGAAQFAVAAGDALRIETPGGGGYGQGINR